VTLYISLRNRAGAGAGLAEFADAYVGPGGTLKKPTIERLEPRDFGDRLAGKQVVLAVHGFNVSYQSGVHVLARLEAEMALGEGWVFVGVLWPGDFWLPVVNYPWEADDAVRSGRRLARFLERPEVGGRAQAFSFLSHSLGARVVLAAAERLPAGRTRAICLAAAAADDNCLVAGHNQARLHSGPITVLSSLKDKTLFLAYPLGDFFSDAVYDQDSPWKGALGRYGAQPEPAAPRVMNFPIPDTPAYDHGDYYPPASGAGNVGWRKVAEHARRLFRREGQVWPRVDDPWA